MQLLIHVPSKMNQRRFKMLYNLMFLSNCALLLVPALLGGQCDHTARAVFTQRQTARANHVPTSQQCTPLNSNSMQKSLQLIASLLGSRRLYSTLKREIRRLGNRVTGSLKQALILDTPSLRSGKTIVKRNLIKILVRCLIMHLYLPLSSVLNCDQF